MAVADEVAAAADLVKGKLSGVPIAIVRGLARDGKLRDDGLGSTTLIRDANEDLFRLGTAEAIALGRAEVVALPEAITPALHADVVAVVSAMPDAAGGGRGDQVRRSSPCWPPVRMPPIAAACRGTSPHRPW